MTFLSYDEENLKKDSEVKGSNLVVIPKKWKKRNSIRCLVTVTQRKNVIFGAENIKYIVQRMN